MTGDPETFKKVRERIDARVTWKANSIGVPLSKIDIRILIYRPDKPPLPEEKQYADVVIRNEKAVDKQ